jgi:hypothetical protein
VRRKTVWQTTWTARVLLVAITLSLIVSTRTIWSEPFALNLVCSSDQAKVDVVVVENLDSDYLLFEQAADLIGQNKARFALVLVQANGKSPFEAEEVPQGVAELMIRIAHLKNSELLPIEQKEPITLNAALQVASSIKGRENINSAIIVTPGFRSKRTHLIFNSVLKEIGVAVSCAPVWGTSRPDNWTTTWHGIQDVFLQYVKLFYYRLFVLYKWA